MNNKKFAVILSGCGRMDGSEIYETTTALLAIKQTGSTYKCFAPNIMQSKVNNHHNGEEMKENRNLLIESARLARGEIEDIKDLNLDDFDVVFFPGGMGAILNLCDYADKGTNCEVNQETKELILQAHKDGKIIGAMCIAPVLVAKVLGQYGVELTIGNDEDSATDIKSFGAKHVKVGKTDVHIDKKNKIVTTPAYMLCSSIDEVYTGAVNIISEILKM